MSQDTPQLPAFVAEGLLRRSRLLRGASLERVRRRFEQLGEPILVDRLFVGFLGRDPFLRQKILDRIVQGLHPHGFSCLHGRCDLDSLGIANEIADGGRTDQDL